MRWQPGDVVALRRLNAGRVSFESRTWPFDRGWGAWRPEPAGAVPRLREEWADVAAG
jgi:hypothetical protein